MKFTLSWLKEHLITDAAPEVIAQKLTCIGIEVESVYNQGAGLESFSVAEILETWPHPDADKLRICKVDTHNGVRQIVCGAPNARAGIKVVLADIGDIIPTSGIAIKATKIRGVDSNGMLCSARELGIGTEDDGIMELPIISKVGTQVITLLGLDDTLFDVSITPNRGDCLGVYGIARDLAAAGLGTLKAPVIPPLHTHGIKDLRVTLNTAESQHFIAYQIDNVVNSPSPAWLSRKLESVGLRPISALVDITNYFTLTYGRPLHVYDSAKLHGNLTVRISQEAESFEALNDKSYLLPAGLCVIADNASVVGLGGIMGGKPSGCTELTTSVILEAAWFDPIAIAHAGRATNIDSDARYRFERGVDPQSTAPYAVMAAQMILDVCGGAITGYSEAGQPPVTSRIITFSESALKHRTGMEVAPSEQRGFLQAIGCNVTEDWSVTTPSWRPDIEGSSDLTEEIARLKGYDHLPETALPLAESLVLSNKTASDKARVALIARGMDETVQYAFTSSIYSEPFKTHKPLITVANPISLDLNTMRPHVFASLLPAIARNIARGGIDMALMEIGTVFFGVAPEEQPIRVCGVRSGLSAVHWKRKPQLPTIYDVKADLEAMLMALDIHPDSLMISRDVPAWYHPGKAGRFSMGPKHTIGYFGELHPAILRSFDISQPVMGFECLLGEVPIKKTKRSESFRLNEFQANRRDFAFVVDKDAPAGVLRETILKADKTLIKDAVLFDVYMGEHLPLDKKSLAFAVTLQAKDHTLTEEELSATTSAIINAAQNNGATLR